MKEELAMAWIVNKETGRHCSGALLGNWQSIALLT